MMHAVPVADFGFYPGACTTAKSSDPGLHEGFDPKKNVAKPHTLPGPIPRRCAARVAPGGDQPHHREQSHPKQPMAQAGALGRHGILAGSSIWQAGVPLLTALAAKCAEVPGWSDPDTHSKWKPTEAELAELRRNVCNRLWSNGTVFIGKRSVRIKKGQTSGVGFCAALNSMLSLSISGGAMRRACCAAIMQRHLGDDMWVVMALIADMDRFIAWLKTAQLTHPNKGWIALRSSEFLKYLITPRGRIGHFARSIGYGSVLIIQKKG